MSTYPKLLVGGIGPSYAGQASPTSNVGVTVYASDGSILITRVSGTNAQQTVTTSGAPTGGHFTLTLTALGQTLTTGSINWNGATTDVQTALRALANVGSNGVTCTGTTLPSGVVTCTFGGILANQPVTIMTKTDSLTGGSTPHAVIASTVTGIAGVQESATSPGVYFYKAAFDHSWGTGRIEWDITGASGIGAVDDFSTSPIDQAQALNNSQTTGTVGDSLVSAEAQGTGKWVLDPIGLTIKLYRHDGTTLYRTFDIDNASSPTYRQ